MGGASLGAGVRVASVSGGEALRKLAFFTSGCALVGGFGCVLEWGEDTEVVVAVVVVVIGEAVTAVGEETEDGPDRLPPPPPPPPLLFS